MTTSFTYDPSRRALVVDDARLTRVLQREPERCASISEYAAATGIETDRVIDLLGHCADIGALRIEPVRTELFIHTAPAGRPTPSHLPDVAPNLWEHLRQDRDKLSAYQLWQLMRAMESVGWRLEANRYRIMFSLSMLPDPPGLGLRLSSIIAPLLIHPTAAQLFEPRGQLSALAGAGAQVVAVVCESGALDDQVTAVRRYLLTGAGPVAKVIIIEAPSYAPVLVSVDDAAVTPRAVSLEALQGSPSGDATPPPPPAVERSAPKLLRRTRK